MSTVWLVALGACALFILLLLAVKIYWSILELAYYPKRERATEVHTVMTRDVWELQVYRYRRGRTSGEPILFVHGAGANHHNFTEPEGACIIDELVGRGYDCWAVDIRTCRSAKPAFERSREQATIDDVLLYDLPAVIRYIRKATSYGRVHWVGHSQGGMLLYAYLQHWGPDFIASGTSIAAPLGFEGARLGVKHMPRFAKKHPRFAANILRGLIPILYYTGVRSKVFPINMKNVHAKVRPSNLFHMIEDPMEGAVEQLLGWGRTQQWTMLGGQLDVKAGLKSLNLPLFILCAPRDPFLPVDRARAFFHALPSADKQFAVLSKENGCQHDYDHCDLAFGVDGPRMINGPIAKWIEAHPISERVRAEEVGEDDIPIRGILDNTQRASILSGAPFTPSAPLAATAPESKSKPEPVREPEPVRVPVKLEVVPIEEAPYKPAVTTPSAVAVKKPTAKVAAKPTEKVVAKAPAKAPKKAAEKAKPAAPKPLVAKAAPAKAEKPAPKPEPAKKAAAKAAPVKAEAKPVSNLVIKPAPSKPVAAKPVASKPPVKPVAAKPAPKPAPKAALAKATPAKAAPAKAAPPKPAPAKPAPAKKVTTATPRVTMAPAKADKGRPSLLTKSAIASAAEALKDLDRKK